VYNADGDWRNLTREFGVSQRTAYRWVKNQSPEKERGGARRIKLTDEHHRYMEDAIENNPRITLEQIKEKIKKDFEMNISKECVRKHLDGLMFTLKNARREPERINSVDNKTKRCEYVRKLLNLQSENKPIIYMDETNFNLFVSRTQGRSKKGHRCSFVAAGSRGANIHLIGCIATTGLIHHEIRRGAFKKPEAKAFVRRCLEIAQRIYNCSVALIIDNAPCHAALEELFQEEEFSHHELIRLSPYSPMLNPIENAWSTIKAHVKSDMALQISRILAGIDRDQLTQVEYRTQQLENVIRNNIQTITVAKCVQYIAHIQRVIPAVLNMDDVHL